MCTRARACGKVGFRLGFIIRVEMKYLPDIPPARKTVGIALIAVLAVIAAQGLGLTTHPVAFVEAATSKVKGFFSGLFKPKG